MVAKGDGVQRERAKVQRSFGGVELLCAMLRWWACTSLSEFIECTTPRVSTNGNEGLCVMMLCQRRFINCNNCHPLVGILVMWEAMHV